MAKKSAEKFLSCYRILLSAMLVISGLCLMIACVGIYLSGDKPFSPEAVAESFSGIAVPIYITLALVLVGFILDLLLPAQKKKVKASRQNALILTRLLEKNDLSSIDFELKSRIDLEQKSRRIHKAIALILLAAGSVIFLIHALNPANFHQSDINGSMARASVLMLCCLAVPFAYAVFAAVYEKKSLARQIDLVRQAVENGCPKRTVEKAEAPKPKRDAAQIGRWALLAAAIGITVYGFAAGGTLDVLTKAINICTECVGLG